MWQTPHHQRDKQCIDRGFLDVVSPDNGTEMASLIAVSMHKYNV